jgi:hypothetical protein
MMMILFLNPFYPLSNPNHQSKNITTIMSPKQYYWVTKLPWAQLFVRSNGNLHLVIHKIIINEMKGKDKLIAHDWDFSFLHPSYKEVDKNIGINTKRECFIP